MKISIRSHAWLDEWVRIVVSKMICKLVQPFDGLQVGSTIQWVDAKLCEIWWMTYDKERFVVQEEKIWVCIC